MKKRIQHKKIYYLSLSVRLGLWAGGVAAFFILLTNIVFPQVPDYGLLSPLVCIGLFSLFGFSGYRAKLANPKDFFAGIKGGALTACIVFCLLFLAFFIIDNVFLAIVSQQPEKIWGFHHSNCSNMRQYINFSLLQGMLFVIPIGTFFGGIMGMFGGVLSKT